MGYTPERQRVRSGSSTRGKIRSRETTSDSSSDEDHRDVDPNSYECERNPDPNTTMEAYSVSMLPYNTTEGQLYALVKDIVSVVSVHIDIHPESRETLTTGSIVVHKNHGQNLMKPIVFEDHPLQFELADSLEVVLSVIKRKQTSVLHIRELEWPYDVRPGHPQFQIQPPIMHRPFDYTPRDQHRLSAHLFSDTIFLRMFKHMSVRDLLNVEMTCRRMIYLVRYVLGGYAFINLADPKCLWAHHRTGVETHYHTLLIQKILILNGSTLQHLHLHTLSFNVSYVVTAVRQCAPFLTHFTYAKLDNLHFTSFHGGEDISHRYVALEDVQANPPFKIFFTDCSIPPCVCTAYLSSVTPFWTSELEMIRRENVRAPDSYDTLFK